ncbi:homeobox protein engrailed-1-like, partial [Plectropomus leopardus]|uniref:homeobox protein engrailed-1-like n=1 Tax=Plectropomus leopardus TaxID=160734 RepID=UPI001C4CD2CA
MEEQRDLNSTDSSEGESVSPSPSLPSPPILPLQVGQQAHRTTNFFIDNILRPDFGCKKEHGLGPRERAHTSGRERVHPVVIRPSLPGTPCQDSNCSSDSSSSSASSASLASPKKSNGGGGGGAPASTGSGGVKAEDRTGGGAAENTSSSLVVLNGTGAPTPESQPLLWPAWVYCTRYSDRPSSGKTRVSRKKNSSTALITPRK